MTRTPANVTNAYLHQCVLLGLDCLHNGSRRPQYSKVGRAENNRRLLSSNPTRQYGTMVAPAYGKDVGLRLSAVSVYC